MEELNIEQKAKRYDEILARAKDTNMPHDMKEFVDYLIPELKDGEDERIRKKLISYFSNIQGFSSLEYNYGITQEEAVAWLEKQREHQEYPKDVIDNATSFLANRNDGMPEEEAKDIVNAIITVLNPSYWPKQVEQKPADKVKPKFKVSDWVVYEEYIYQIHNISLKKYYECLRIDGTVHTFDFEYIDSKSRLWTIQDAKDGDVLSSGSNNPFIFSGFLANNVVGAYCGINKGGNFYIPIFNNNWTVLPVFPATKEQRDLLFQKMKEAGYEWDAEKNELKEIEQKPAWSEEDENLLKLSLENLTELKDRFGEKYGKVSDCIHWLNSLMQRMKGE